jgi:hypothetical protein
LLASAGDCVTKICAAARYPLAFAASTFAASAQVPPVSVSVNEIVFDE